MAGRIAGMLVLVLVLCGAAIAQDPSGAAVPLEELKFVRISKDSKGNPVSLDTAIVTLVPDAGTGMGSPDTSSNLDSRPLEIALVSAVHIGEGSYYAELNRRFGFYDAVLYELVADANVQQRADFGSGGDHPVSVLQRSLQNLLKLEFQLSAIDYRAANFVHADMTPDQLSKSMSARNESLGSLLMRATLAAMSKDAQGGGKPPDLSSMFLLIFDETRAIALRRLLASEFEDMDQLLETLNGQEGSAILTDRNAVALQVLSSQVALGKRKIAIFYGGAHMPDMARRLQQSLHLYPGQVEWLTAWRLK